jgi:hypothetical protein
MKMFSDCSGPCSTCKIHYTGGCLAGHGDDDYFHASPEWIKKLTEHPLYGTAFAEKRDPTWESLL